MNQFNYIKKHPNGNYDNNEDIFDYSIIDNESINFGGIKFNNYDNFMLAIMSKYPRIFAQLFNELFSENSGINPSRLSIKGGIYENLKNVISGNQTDIRGGDMYYFKSYKDITEICDFSNIYYSTDPNDKPITITLPTTDFLKLIEHIIKTTPQEKD